MYIIKLPSFLIRIIPLHILLDAAFTTMNGKWTEKLTCSKQKHFHCSMTYSNETENAVNIQQ